MLMPDEQFRSALHRWQTSGDISARNEIVVAFVPLVRKIAQKTRKRLVRCITVDQLESSGYLGLMQAIDNFDITRNLKFQTFAHRRIHGAMIDDLRQSDPIPRLVRQRRAQAAEITDQFLHEKNRPPTEEELQGEMGLNDAKFRFYSAVRNRQFVSLSTPICNGVEGSNLRLKDEIEGRRIPDADAKLEFDAIIDNVLVLYGIRYALLLRLYYRDGITMKEIGEALGTSESRISQLHKLLLRQIKSLFRSPKREAVC